MADTIQVQRFRIWLQEFFKPDLSLGRCLDMLRGLVAANIIPKVPELVKLADGFARSNMNIVKNSTMFYQMILNLHINAASGNDIKPNEAYLLAVKLAYHTREQQQIIFNNTLKKTGEKPVTAPPKTATTNGRDVASGSRPPTTSTRTVRTNHNAAGTSRQHIQMAPGTAFEKLKSAFQGAECDCKLLEGRAYIEWKNARKYETNLKFLGKDRAENGFCDAMRDDMTSFLSRKKDKARYVVLVEHNNVAVSAVVCTLSTNGPQASKHVVVEYICTNKMHGKPLMTFIEDYAKEHGLRYVKLVSVLVSVPFYEKLGYVRSPNACIEKSLTAEQIAKAEKDWVSLKKWSEALVDTSNRAYTKFLNTHSKRVYKKPEAQAIAIEKLQKLKNMYEHDKADYENRFSAKFVNGWCGKLPDGSYMYDRPVHFANDTLESTYKLPVLSKCV